MARDQNDKRAADVAIDVSRRPDGLDRLLAPTLDGVAMRAHGVVDNARSAAEGVVAEVGKEGRRLAKELEYRGDKLADAVGENLGNVVADIDARAAKQQAAFAETQDDLASSYMDRVLIIAAAGVIAYTAYFIQSHRNPGDIDLTKVLLFFWMGITFLSSMLWVAHAISGRKKRLKNMLLLSLYVLALGGVVYAAVLGMTIIGRYLP